MINYAYGGGGGGLEISKFLESSKFCLCERSQRKISLNMIAGAEAQSQPPRWDSSGREKRAGCAHRGCIREGWGRGREGQQTAFRGANGGEYDRV